MSFTQVPIRGTWGGQSGKVVVTPPQNMTNSGISVPKDPQTFKLDGSGSVSFKLFATDDPGTTDAGTYEFYIELVGQPVSYFATIIPRAQAGAGINIVTQLPWGYSPPPVTAGPFFAAASVATLPAVPDGSWGFTSDGHIAFHTGGSWTTKV